MSLGWTSEALGETQSAPKGGLRDTLQSIPLLFRGLYFGPLFSDRNLRMDPLEQTADNG